MPATRLPRDTAFTGQRRTFQCLRSRLWGQPVSIYRGNRGHDKPLVVSLALDGQGKLFLDGVLTSREGVQARLAELAPSQPELHLRADRVTPYEKVADTLTMAQRAGVMKIAFVTKAVK